MVGTHRPELRRLARQVLDALDGYASLDPPARAARVEAALKLLTSHPTESTAEEGARLGSD